MASSLSHITTRSQDHSSSSRIIYDINIGVGLHGSFTGKVQWCPIDVELYYVTRTSSLPFSTSRYSDVLFLVNRSSSQVLVVWFHLRVPVILKLFLGHLPKEYSTVHGSRRTLSHYFHVFPRLTSKPRLFWSSFSPPFVDDQWIHVYFLCVPSP